MDECFKHALKTFAGVGVSAKMLGESMKNLGASMSGLDGIMNEFINSELGQTWTYTDSFKTRRQRIVDFFEDLSVADCPSTIVKNLISQVFEDMENGHEDSMFGCSITDGVMVEAIRMTALYFHDEYHFVKLWGDLKGENDHALNCRVEFNSWATTAQIIKEELHTVYTQSQFTNKFGITEQMIRDCELGFKPEQVDFVLTILNEPKKFDELLLLSTSHEDSSYIGTGSIEKSYHCQKGIYQHAEDVFYPRGHKCYIGYEHHKIEAMYPTFGPIKDHCWKQISNKKVTPSASLVSKIRAKRSGK